MTTPPVLSLAGRSLRLRLLAGAAVAVFLALAAALAVMSFLFERHLTRTVEAELTRSGVALAAGLTIAPDGRPAVDFPPADPRFGQLASGLYWQLSTDAGAVHSRSLWDQELERSDDATGSGWTLTRLDGPFNARLLVVERLLRPDRAGPAVLAQVATDLSSVTAPRDAFARELALFLLVLWLVLSLAAWAQVELGLAPLAKVRAALAAMQRDPAARLQADGLPQEVAPLAAAIDDLAAAREQDLARARRRAADLAHSLKTPIAALAAETRRAREAGASEAADGLQRAKDAIAWAVESELARARVALASTSGRETALALPAIDVLIDVLERTDAGERVAFENEAPQAFRLRMAQQDLVEILGPLLENAARYAKHRVKISGAIRETERELLVEDDGPGLDAERAPQALMRGVRLDQSGGGHGLGLAISRDLMEASGGALTLEQSSLGGLAVRLVWPYVRNADA